MGRTIMRSAMKKRESKGREHETLGRVRFRAGGREGVREKVAGGRERESLFKLSSGRRAGRANAQNAVP